MVQNLKVSVVLSCRDYNKTTQTFYLCLKFELFFVH